MLHEFLTDNRNELVTRCQAKVAQRQSPLASNEELEYGIPLFLDQLIKTLQIEEALDPMLSRKVSGPTGGGAPSLSEVGEAAARHGRELLKRGFTVEQVVHDYGDLCQAITDLAFEVDAPIEVNEFRTLNRCLDNGIAMAVTEFNYMHDINVATVHTEALNERLGIIAHELRNFLATATVALSVIKDGHVGVTGATGAILERSLAGMSKVIDRSLAEVRMTAGLPVQNRLISLADFISEVSLTAALDAQARECTLKVYAVDSQLTIDVDRDLLLAAVGNLLQNAFKFTQHATEVTIYAYAAGDRILIEIEDRCGGLPPDTVDEMFRSFTQVGTDKSGLGLGLSIAQRSVEANGGTLSVRDVPRSGCIFIIELPRHTLPQVT